MVRKETVIVHNNEGYKRSYQPFGVQSVIFQQNPLENQLQDTNEIAEPQFLDKQFVLLVYDSWKGVSLRKVTDMMMNLIYFETSMTVSWNLYRFDK